MSPIYEYTAARAWFSAWVAHQPDDAKRTFRKRLCRELGVDVKHLNNLLSGERLLQQEMVATLAALAGLDASARDYLRQLVALVHASPAEVADLQRSAWRTHAEATGRPTAGLGGLLGRDPGSVALALLSAFPLLAELPGAMLEAEPLAERLIVRPDPAGLAEMLDLGRQGERFGEARHLRCVAIPGPGPVAGLGGCCWRSALRLARSCLVRIPDRQRDYHLLIYAVDQLAVDQAEAAIADLLRRLVALSRKALARPAHRVYYLLIEHLRVSQVLRQPDADYRPPLESAFRRLRDPETPPITGESSTAAADLREDGPCLLHFFRFSEYARAWIAFRDRIRRPRSLSWLFKQQGRVPEGMPVSARLPKERWLSRSLLGELCSGAALLRHDHLLPVIRAFGLPEDAMSFLDGMVRLAWASDEAEEGRARMLLAAYAAAQGQRTLASEDFRFWSHWAGPVVHELACLPAFANDAWWIVNALAGRLSVDTVADMMELLATLSLTDRKTGRPAPDAQEVLSSEARVSRLARFALNESLLELLETELHLPAPDRQLRGLALALPDTALPEAQQLLTDFHARTRLIFNEATVRGCQDRVVILANQFFPITVDLRAPP